MLSVNNLGKSVKGKQILKDLSFDVPRGSIAAFLGGSGQERPRFFASSTI